MAAPPPSTDDAAVDLAPFDTGRFRWWARLIRFLGHLLCRTDCRPDRVPDTDGRPIVLVANHRSLADVFVSVDALGRFDLPTRCLVRATYFERRGLGRWLRWLGCIPAGDGRGGSFAAAAETLAAGHPVAIMVEGRITPPDQRDEDGLGEFRPGFVAIAREADAAIVPIAIVGTDEVWPSRATLPRLPWRGRPTVHVHVLEPILIGDRTDDEVMAATRKAMAAEIAAIG